MATLYLLCGLAFSGKTTIARELARRSGALYLSLDEINAGRGLTSGQGLPAEEWERTHAVAMERIRAAYGRDVVLDDTSCYRWLRERYRELAAEAGLSFTLLYVDVPLDEIERRRAANERSGVRPPVADDVFREHVATFEPPDEDEPCARIASNDQLSHIVRI